MEKLDGKSKDIVKNNIVKLKQIFPDVFNEDGIDFDALKGTLGEYVDNKEERYQFTWHGKTQARRLAQTPSTGTLRPCKEESVNWDDTENLFIEGDNLEVLKLLQKSYHKKIKMIYIDPPYNTGNDFVYKDDFRDNIKNYKELTRQLDESGKSLSTNSETSGRYHTDWLNMMYPRLKLARNLLKDDGVIFISIDDNEVSNLRKICNEIFGEENFICEYIYAGNSSKNNAKNISITHEYSVIYARDINFIKLNNVQKNNVDEFNRRIQQLFNNNLSNKEISTEIRALTKYPRFYDFDHYTMVDEKGAFRANDLTAMNSNNFFDIIHPTTKKACKKSSRGWAYNQESLDTLLAQELIYFGEDENSVPQLKCYLKDSLLQVPKSLGFYDAQVDTKQLKRDGIPFDFPKPSAMIELFIEMSMNKREIMLDFFAGSGTSAFSLLKQNLRDKVGRKFIMVQLPELCVEKSEAYKAGYKTIADIGKERIRRVIKKIETEQKENKKKGEGELFEQNDSDEEKLDLGFKVFKLDASNISTWDPDFDNVQQDLLSAVDNIKTDRTEEDVLYEILLKYGLDLTVPIEELEIKGKKVFVVGMGALIVSLASDVTVDIVEEIAKLREKYQPESEMRVVFKDSSFKDDVVKTNAVQILKQHGIEDVKSI